MNDDEEIPRALDYISPEAFRRLVNLTGAAPWLESLTLELTDLWNMCVSTCEQDLIEDLLRRYRCVTSKNMQGLGEETASQICCEWALTHESTVVAAISDRADADGSQMFIQSLKNKFGEYGEWDEHNFVNRIGDSLGQLSKRSNVVLVDDFIGTGRTIERRVTWYKKRLDTLGLSTKVNLYIVTIAAMRFSRERLDKLGVSYFAPIWLGKGISEQYEGEERQSALDAMLRMEQELKEEINGTNMPSLGFGQSESLFAVEAHNVPNNVFPIFWWPRSRNDSRRRTLLKRLI